MPERRSPLYDYHLRHGGRLIAGGGEFQFPDAYTSPADEHLNVRANAGVQDLSSMGEVDIKGPGAESGWIDLERVSGAMTTRCFNG